LTIGNHQYQAMTFKRLTLKGDRKLNARLRAHETHSTYGTRHDVIVGPLVTQPKCRQQKFQTVRAEALLNGTDTQWTVRP
jgi:hypothetical protein